MSRREPMFVKAKFFWVGVFLMVLMISGWFLMKSFNSNAVLLTNKDNKTVVDCSSEDLPCVEKEITDNIINCVPYSDPAECETTKDGLQDVTLIADATNYIPIPFTSEKFTANVMDVQLDVPRELDFLPDGSMLVIQRDGKILKINGESSEVVHQVSSVYIPENSAIPGLTGLAVDPEFSENGNIYIYYTYELDLTHPTATEFSAEGIRRVNNRLSKLTFENGKFGAEEILINNIPGTFWHSGGRVKFGPDNKLYVTTGEANEYDLSQDLDFLGGKILRVNTDGSIPSDNPFEDKYIYSLGHRNPQGISWHPDTDKLYSSEHGPWRYDEINIVDSLQNYGWGTYQCGDLMDGKTADDIRILKNSVKNPIYCTKSWTLAPSGIDFVSDKNHPWHSSLFVAALRGKHLHRYEFDGEKIITDEIFFVAGKDLDKFDANKVDNRIRSVKYHDGALYVIGDKKGLVKITPK